MRIACWVATPIFALFAYWQFNDREQYGTELWWAWVLLYATTAVVSLVWSRRPLSSWLVLGGSGLVFVAAAVRAMDIDWQGKLLFDPGNPAANETGGLLVVCIWLLVLGVFPPRDSPPSS